MSTLAAVEEFMPARVWSIGLAVFLLLLGASGPTSPDTRLKSQEELRLEAVIESAYRSCFRSYWVAGQLFSLRIPFGQNEERKGTPRFDQRIFLGGKGTPDQLWAQVDSLLFSEGFQEYIRLLRQPGEKVIEFDLEKQSYSVYWDPVLAQILKEEPYPGMRTHVYILKTDSEITEIEIYNFLYCVGSVGMDCSGFVYFVQKSVAAAYGWNLDAALAKAWGIKAARVHEIVGLWLFDPQSGYTERVDDWIEAIRPGDIFLFRGREHTYRHSAVIQSIDAAQGCIRYVQCTDWAPQRERGVHASVILFDPSRSDLRLSDPSVRWMQEINPTFPGEPGLRYWRNDGDRYRSYLEEGGSLIVRMRLVRDLLEQAEPRFYAIGLQDFD
jgi:hypothetical protein